MTSLTTMSATSDLMQTPADERSTGSQTTPPPCLTPSRVKPWAAIAAVVISVSLIGGIAVGLTTPPSTAVAAAEPA
jgi:hypothetical protein